MLLSSGLEPGREFGFWLELGVRNTAKKRMRKQGNERREKKAKATNSQVGQLQFHMLYPFEMLARPFEKNQTSVLIVQFSWIKRKVK